MAASEQIKAECDCAAEACKSRNYCMAARIAELERELNHFTSSGIGEVAVRNPSVMEYMEHWEGRAMRAENRIAELEADRDKWKGQMLSADYQWAEYEARIAELEAKNGWLINESEDVARMCDAAWNAALEAAAASLHTYAPHREDGPKYDDEYYRGYHTAFNRIRALMKKEGE